MCVLAWHGASSFVPSRAHSVPYTLDGTKDEAMLAIRHTAGRQMWYQKFNSKIKFYYLSYIYLFACGEAAYYQKGGRGRLFAQHQSVLWIDAEFFAGMVPK